MSHRNLVVKRLSIPFARHRSHFSLPRSKKNFSYCTTIVKFFSEQRRPAYNRWKPIYIKMLIYTWNLIDYNNVLFSEQNIRTFLHFKNHQNIRKPLHLLYSLQFHTSNLYAFWRRVRKVATISWEEGRKIPYARDIHERNTLSMRGRQPPIGALDLPSLSTKRSLSLSLDEMAIVRIQAGTQLDGRESRSRKDGAKWIEYRSAKDKIVSRRYYRFSLVPYSLPRLCERVTWKWSRVYNKKCVYDCYPRMLVACWRISARKSGI